jgi:hypothetical protein
LSSVTKAKISLKEGIIELEGSEAFVTKHLEAFKKDIARMKVASENQEHQTSDFDNQNSPKKKRKAKGTTPRIVQPIPLDLKQKENILGFKEFYKQKSPKSDMERVAVIAYYLKKYHNKNNIEAGHVVSCCKEVHCRVPADIKQTFKNAQHRYGWVKVLENGKFAEITIQGENLVENDLPRKRDAERIKAAA